MYSKGFNISSLTLVSLSSKLWENNNISDVLGLVLCTQYVFKISTKINNLFYVEFISSY